MNPRPSETCSTEIDLAKIRPVQIHSREVGSIESCRDHAGLGSKSIPFPYAFWSSSQQLQGLLSIHVTDLLVSYRSHPLARLRHEDILTMVVQVIAVPIVEPDDP